MTTFIQKYKPTVAECWRVFLVLARDKGVQEALFANVIIWIKFYFQYLA